MEYREALDYIYSLTNYEAAPAQAYSSANYDLRRMEYILESVGSPHLGPVTVHIAGTKGKGSTAAMVASALSASGYATGLYTSPHLHTIRERIRVDEKLISPEDMAHLTERLKPLVQEMNRTAIFGAITTFEILTALAFCHFRERQVKCQVLEVGMGGRLDATNVARPTVCIVTPISLDHTAILGDTVEKIAKEKAGIIKPGSVVVTAPQLQEAENVILQVCSEAGVKALFVEREASWSRQCASVTGQRVTVHGLRDSYTLKLPLLGRHQIENAATAIVALEILAERMDAVTSESIVSGLERVSWPGRMQVLKEDPLWIVDGAHNPASACRLRAALEEDFSCPRAIFIIGTSSDKDISGIAEELASMAKWVVATKANNPRSLDPTTIAREFAQRGVEVVSRETVADAVATAQAMAGRGDVICGTGSLFLVAEVIQTLSGVTMGDPRG